MAHGVVSSKVRGQTQAMWAIRALPHGTRRCERVIRGWRVGKKTRWRVQSFASRWALSTLRTAALKGPSLDDRRPGLVGDT